MSFLNRLGFMQGRLVPMVSGKIQAFPFDTWQKEFPYAVNLGLSIMEWTLDQDNLSSNPLLTQDGQKEISSLCNYYGISILP